MLYKFFFLFLLLGIFCFACNKQIQNNANNNTLNKEKIQKGKDYFQGETGIRYENYIYRPNIKTVRLYVDGNEFSDPVVQLNSEASLKLEFDDLDGDVKNYSYNIILCDYNWQPSTLFENQYLEGFFDGQITFYRISFNSRQKYTHYELNFPNERLKPTKPGNYILMVFQDGDKEKPILTQRFFVNTHQFTVKPQFKKAARSVDVFTRQELDFVIETNNVRINNPFGDIKILIMQNNRWDNAVTGLKPTFVSNSRLTYDYNRENIFDGGNEFRNFDIRSIYTKSLRVRNIVRDSVVRVQLLPDGDRSGLPHETFQDLNGKFRINVIDPQISLSDADYAFVQFVLPYETPVSNGNVHLVGELTNWQLNKKNKMIYNYALAAYEIELYLKQGFYDYAYAFVKDGSEKADLGLFEGNFFETENTYQIFVYHRPPGQQFDALIGYKKTNSIW